MAVPVVIFVASEAFTRSGSSADSEAPYSRAYEGLCEAHASASRGDVGAAEKTFHDTAHEPLHELSKDAQQRDRSAAARLLEAKGRVESGFESGERRIAPDLATLLVATRDAFTAAGEPKPSPCPSEETR